MVLPSEIGLQSAGTVDGDDEIGCWGGYHLQYEIHGTLVNVVILRMDVDYVDPLPLELEWLEKLGIASMVPENEEGYSMEETDSYDQMVEKIEEWIETISEPTLREILASMSIDTRPETADNTLHAFFHRPIINLQLKTIDGKVTVIRHEGVPPWPKDPNLSQPFGQPIKLPVKARLPIYTPSEVAIFEQCGVYRVCVDNQTLRCKLCWINEATLRECEIYRKLSTMDTKLRVPALKGYVQYEDESGIVAFLLEDIAVNKLATHALAFGPSGSDSSSLQTSEFPSIDRRRKWMHQIKDIVKVLHENDIVWGDVKPANVVIDVNDDAWVLDFGGGFTRPWKSLADADTILGDLKALSLMERYFETGEMPPLDVKAGASGNVSDDMVVGTEQSQQDLEQSLHEADAQELRGKRKHPGTDESGHVESKGKDAIQ